MRINRNMLLKVANDAVNNYIGKDRTLLAIYLQGSLLGEFPLIGNTADIDLFLVHTDDVVQEREVIKVSDEVHLDISHHLHSLYRQPRELRVHPWLGPTVYGCKILYDPQHFMDFTQASVRGQFYSTDNVLNRTRKQAGHAREIWQSFYADPHNPNPEEASLYLLALEHVANAIAGLSGKMLTERRFLMDFPMAAEAVNRGGLYAGFLGLLGAAKITVDTMRSWLPAWREAYAALPAEKVPVRLHPFRWQYYERAVNAMLETQTFRDALWPLWHTWTLAICALPAENPHLDVWRHAGEQIELLGPAFSEKVAALDVYLDSVEELLDSWGNERRG